MPMMEHLFFKAKSSPGGQNRVLFKSGGKPQQIGEDQEGKLQKRIEALIRWKFTRLMIGKFPISPGEEHEALDERIERQCEALRIVSRSVHP